MEVALEGRQVNLMNLLCGVSKSALALLRECHTHQPVHHGFTRSFPGHWLLTSENLDQRHVCLEKGYP